ncbi:MAG: hypothetical protein AAGD35_02555 [Actinomycetota bacterium]
MAAGLAIIGLFVLLVGAAALVLFVRADSDGDLSIDRRPLSAFESAEYATRAEWEGADAFGQTYGVVIPPSATDIGIASDGFMDVHYDLRFEIDADDLEALVEHPSCGGLLPQAESPLPHRLFSERQAPWWTLDEATAWASCAADGQGIGVARQYVIDRSDPDRSIVYLRVTTF